MLDNDMQEYGNSMIHMKNRHFSKDELNSEKYREPYKTKLSCSGEKCYYFSDRDKNFEKSHKFCVSLGSHLLKTEDKDKQKFIQPLVSFFHWIGLSPNGMSAPGGGKMAPGCIIISMYQVLCSGWIYNGKQGGHSPSSCMQLNFLATYCIRYILCEEMTNTFELFLN
ncbi:killer cell lectin-like receptor subfamily G member 1 [Diceros bicornis minor]|uniref:killer cell lectin-like receptor subfamily G member 1 n=1 Tax=Diceros bicornis minor TaxID=77932 RepID=UPI0026F2BEBC|nr:killer cell lectin-like receptor subfamily G member 1 [Diceros bicornis minor]